MQEKAFPEEIKKTKWDIQNHKCAICGEDLDFKDCVGDHIVPWSLGCTTTLANCQVLCVNCNSIKSNKWTRQAKDIALALRTKVSTN